MYVVYHFNCPGCCASYVAKTQQTLHERYHVWNDKGSAHINECDGIKNIKNIMFLNTSVDRDITISGHRHTNINLLMFRIIDSHRDWNVLL